MLFIDVSYDGSIAFAVCYGLIGAVLALLSLIDWCCLKRSVYLSRLYFYSVDIVTVMMLFYSSRQPEGDSNNMGPIQVQSVWSN